MSNFTIMTDSSCDLPIDMIEEMGVKVVPMGITFDGTAYKHYHDFRELSGDKFYDGMRDGKVGSTSGTNIVDAQEAIRKELSDGKDVIYLSISSGLSCAYQNVCLAAEELREEFPDSKIAVIDTKSVTMGVGLMICEATKMQRSGVEFDAIVDYVHSKCPRVLHLFTIDDLSHLQRSGRISHLSAIVGSVVGIKPILAIDENGKIKTVEKVRGRKASIKRLLSYTQKWCTNTTSFEICHAAAAAEAVELKNSIQESYPDANVVISELGPMIGVNTGPGTMALISIGDSRQI